MKSAWVMVLCLAGLTGCSEPTIDVSSEDSFKVSVEKVRESLPVERRFEFDESMQTLALSQLDMKGLLAGGSSSLVNLESRLKDAVSGKNAEQIISEASRVRADRQAKEREQALAEIAELKEKRRLAADAKGELQKVEVLRSRFYIKKNSFMGEPIIELTVKNGTSWPVSRIFFDASLASPGRSVPWVVDDFNYSISGGLEPGEQQTWKLVPNIMSGWGRREYPADAVLAASVVRIDGANGETLASTKGFDEDEERRLSKLQKKYGIE